MLETINEIKLGSGLFEHVAPLSMPLSNEVEQKIISFLSLNDIIRCACVNKSPWLRRMEEEIKRRKGCVTVFTWTAAEAASERAQGRLGHSALRTYSGGKEGKGSYVSFYPGDCDQKERHPSCRKSVSHFHKESQEDWNKLTLIDLYGLDITAINQAFEEMHDSEMNSKQPWRNRYNCSDVVLMLLEKAGLYKQISYKRYGSKTMLSFGIIIGTLSLEFLRLSPIILKNFSHIFFLGVPTWDSIPFSANDLIRSLVPAGITGLLFYNYGMWSSVKLDLPTHYFKKEVIQDSAKIALISFLWLTLSSSNLTIPIPFLQSMQKILARVAGWAHDKVLLEFTILQNLIMTGSFKYPEHISTIISFHGGKVGPAWRHVIYELSLHISSVIAAFSLLSTAIVSSYSYNTITTPNHLLNILKVGAQPSIDKSFLNRYFFFNLTPKKLVNSFSRSANISASETHAKNEAVSAKTHWISCNIL